jgi:hypothetical protein
MRKLKIACIALVVVTAAAAVLAKDQLNRNVILLVDGRVIPFDRVWESGADLFYENNREIHFVRQADIRSMGRQSLDLILHAGTAKAADYARSCWEGTLTMFRSGPDGHVNLVPWLVLASMAAPALIFVGLRRMSSRRDSSPARQHAAAPRESRELPGRSDVVRFFLQLFRRQIGAPPEAVAEFGQLPGVSTGSSTVYELRVRNGTEWVKRRMTIGPLGEESGSRSKCFYVIFDRHLVVKIPPKPITRLDEYLEGIRKERHIVERLAPKECIVPQVSVILTELHRLSPGAASSPDQQEQAYVSWLRKHPEQQECLKINGTFVFFMDLSRYYFLSQIIDGLNDLSAPIRAEIAATPDLIRYPARLKERYGAANDAVGFDIRDLYNQAEAEAHRLLQAGAAMATVTPHHIQCWFLGFLENRQIGAAGPTLPGEMTAALNSAFTRLFEKHSAAVEAYLAAIRAFARKLALEQNRAAISGVVTHLLELTAWLSERRVAMRDLKPDNLLVAGDPQNYPGFLRSPAEYSLGFIDVETAVYYGKADSETLKQPLLGGTPYYATPSHLFPNTVLAACFGDATRILHLQDWQSIMVMVYRSITGRLLFDRTAKCFGEIKGRVIQAMRNGEALDGHLVQASREFWQSAGGEFHLKMKAAEKALRFIEADIPPTAAVAFVRVLNEEVGSLEADMRRLIESQTAFPNAVSREQLMRSSRRRIEHLARELEVKADSSKATDTLRATRALLNRLARMKALTERKTRVAKALSGPEARRLSAYDILVILFECVRDGMLREAWTVPAGSPGDPAAAPPDEISLATTV